MIEATPEDRALAAREEKQITSQWEENETDLGHPWFGGSLPALTTRPSETKVVLFVSLIAVFSGVILCLAYGVVLVCRSLSMMIDAFCCDIVTQTSPQEVAHVWNLTQAVLRKASVSVENGLLVLCIILATMVPLLLIDGIMGGGASPPLPTLLPGILAPRVSAQGVALGCHSPPWQTSTPPFSDDLKSAKIKFLSRSPAVRTLRGRGGFCT